MDLLAQVRATIDAHDLLAPGSTVVVAVSGGPDSLCLLHVLLRLQGELGLRLHVAHLNHRLRPEAEAEADAAFVAALAERWGLPYTVGVADVPTLAQAERRSIEEAARVARYRFLAEVAQAVEAGTVAAGHNADDQVETVVMHCLRGSGLAGLRGMRYCAPWPEAGGEARPGLRLVRPLLGVPRRDVEAYLHEQGLKARLDRTNVEMTLFRNRIRHELIPTLETFSPEIRRLLRRTADLLADDYDFLQQSLAERWPEIVQSETAEAVVLRTDAFRRLARSLQRGALRRAIGALRPSLRDIGWVHVERARLAALAAPTGTLITLPAGLVLELRYGRLIVRRAGPAPPEPQALVLVGGERRLQVPGTTPLAPEGWAIEARMAEGAPPPAALQDERGGLCLDAGRAGQDLRLRTRRPGDRFQPRGMGGHSKSIKDYMIDAKIPRAERDRLPLLVSEQGLLWVVGRRAGEVGAPTPETRHFLCLQLIPPRQARTAGRGDRR